MHSFEKAIRKHGEQAYLLGGTQKLPFKMSITESTHAVFSLNNRVNAFEGQALKSTSDVSATALKLGDYVERQCAADAPLMIIGSIPEPYKNVGLIYVYLLRCNAKATITRVSGTVDPNDETQMIEATETVADNVWVNRDVTTRSLKAINTGLLDQTIYLLYIPKSFGVKVEDEVHMNGSIYRVDSINDSLVTSDFINGVDVLQLTYSEDEQVENGG
jgi:hypothetical protein